MKLSSSAASESMHKCVCETCQVRWGVVSGGEDDDCNGGGDADVIPSTLTLNSITNQSAF